MTRAIFLKVLATLGLGQGMVPQEMVGQEMVFPKGKLCIASTSDPNYKCPEPRDPEWVNQDHTNHAFSVLIADLDERVKKLESGENRFTGDKKP